MTEMPDPALPSALSLVALVAVLVMAAVIAGVGITLVRQRAANRTLRERVDEAARSADTFFDLVTHELRSPLAAILGYQELIADGAYGEMDERVAEPVDRIGRSAQHLLHLIEGLVEVGRLRAGIVTPHMEDTDLRLIAIALADGLRVHASDRHIAFETDIERDLPTIRSDPDRLVRALDLLLVSAVKHPGDGAIRLDVRREQEAIAFRVSGARIPIRQDAQDPAVRFGLRIAAADGIATILGGSLELEGAEGEAVRAVTLRVTDGRRTRHPD